MSSDKIWMDRATLGIGIAGLLVAGISGLFAFQANQTSGEANRQAAEANLIAIAANQTAMEAAALAQMSETPGLIERHVKDIDRFLDMIEVLQAGLDAISETYRVSGSENMPLVLAALRGDLLGSGDEVSISLAAEIVTLRACAELDWVLIRSYDAELGDTLDMIGELIASMQAPQGTRPDSWLQDTRDELRPLLTSLRDTLRRWVDEIEEIIKDMQRGDVLEAADRRRKLSAAAVARSASYIGEEIRDYLPALSADTLARLSETLRVTGVTVVPIQQNGIKALTFAPPGRALELASGFADGTVPQSYLNSARAWDLTVFEAAGPDRWVLPSKGMDVYPGFIDGYSQEIPDLDQTLVPTGPTELDGAFDGLTLPSDTDRQVVSP